jgi:hypothetical protein
VAERIIRERKQIIMDEKKKNTHLQTHATKRLDDNKNLC